MAPPQLAHPPPPQALHAEGAKFAVVTTGRNVVTGTMTGRRTNVVTGCITVCGQPVQGSLVVTGLNVVQGTQLYEVR